MGSLGLTEFDAALKEIYTEEEIANVCLRKRPLLTKMKKIDDGEGDVIVVPVFHGNPAGRSASFANAQTNAANSKSKKFNITLAEDFNVINISARVIAASRSKRGAFLQARKNEIDMALDQLMKSAAHAAYRSGSGSIGKRSSLAGNVITLTNVDDAKHFEIDMVLTANDTDNATTPRAGSAKVTAVDRTAGKVTVDNAGGITAFADGDFLFVQGDADAKMKGLAGWLPDTAPVLGGGDNWFGVDRGADPDRLAGLRYDASVTGASTQEALLHVGELLIDAGGEPDAAFMGHARWSDLVKDLGSKVEYVDQAGGDAKVGFRGVRVYTSGTVVECYPDPYCPSDHAYVLTMGTWTLHHLEGFPHLAAEDGKTSQRQGTADGIEVRARYWAQMSCRAPGWNAAIKF